MPLNTTYIAVTMAGLSIAVSTGGVMYQVSDNSEEIEENKTEIRSVRDETLRKISDVGRDVKDIKNYLLERKHE